MLSDKLIHKCLLIPAGMIMLILISACNKDQHNHPELSTGKDFYNYHCASCHKKDGSGMFLKGIPANIATDKSQTEIILHIKAGTQSKKSQMPVYSNMPDSEAYKIANYLLKLKSDYMNNRENRENRDKDLLQRKK